MGGGEWEELNSELAAYLIDSTSRELAYPAISHLEKSQAFRRVCGSQWPRNALAKVSAHKVSAPVQRAIRNPFTKEIATKLRAKLRQIWFAPPPILSENPLEWRAPIAGAGISSLA